MHLHLVIRQTRRPLQRDFNEQFGWLCSTLGFDSEAKNAAYIILRRIMRNANEGVTTAELVEELHSSRGTVVHHLNKLLRAGLIIRSGRRYVLRERNLEATIEEMKKDIERLFDELERIASQIDEGWNK